MNNLKEFTANFKNIPQKKIDLFLSLASKEKFKKNDLIAKIGEKTHYFYIIESGIIRSFYTDEKGKEFTRTIFTKQKTTGPLATLITGEPSKLTYECLSDCTVYKINYNEFVALAKKDISMANLYSKMLEFIFLVMESKIYDLSALNATERYYKLKKEIPDIDNLIPQYHIASYLNVSPVQLSRIRKEMYSK
ncbi:Crp/Fnr family transcriptional regulator [Polaribacter sp. KT25b]|uniref:Crp/Fnr family transcriptional regulator n=1 Tax=Polaribacter sp. KT25b TaxID=1855336 RepID=UPI0012FDBCCF|nr:Crp/Fnr family transcriptional regulator [Polaribacter sp. KT25b]